MDLSYMEEALLEAGKAYEEDEVPIGAIIVYHNKIIARGHNEKEKRINSLAHAEMIAINEACHYLHSRYLDDCTMYVTIEPCIMCAGAIINARIPRVVIGAGNKRFGGLMVLMEELDPKLFNHHPEITLGIKEEECANIMQTYFKKKRSEKNGL